jgi:hypothetical protein
VSGDEANVSRGLGVDRVVRVTTARQKKISTQEFRGMHTVRLLVAMAFWLTVAGAEPVPGGEAKPGKSAQPKSQAKTTPEERNVRRAGPW